MFPIYLNEKSASPEIFYLISIEIILPNFNHDKNINGKGNTDMPFCASLWPEELFMAS
jgi:hypothetical protein